MHRGRQHARRKEQHAIARHLWSIPYVAAYLGVPALSNVIPIVVDRGLGAGGLLSSVVLLAWSATSAVTALAGRWLPHSWTPRAQLADADDDQPGPRLGPTVQVAASEVDETLPAAVPVEGRAQFDKATGQKLVRATHIRSDQHLR